MAIIQQIATVVLIILLRILHLPPVLPQQYHKTTFIMPSSDFHILQANLRKSREISHSLFNDESLKSHVVIFTTEPWAKFENNIYFTAPAYHTYWQPFFPTKQTISLDRRSPPFRVMIWINKKFSIIQQITIPHHDICDLIFHTDDRDLFLVSVYIPCSTNNCLVDNTELGKRINLLCNTFLHKQQAKPHLELILTGDFNRCDTLWGGNCIASHSRQGKGQILINLMADLDLQLLLPQGTITYTGATSPGNTASTIDLIFSSARLAEDWILCTTSDTDHGSDHAAIETLFSMNTSQVPVISPRWLFKSAPWNKIQQTVMEKLFLLSASPTDIDNYANQLIQIVQAAIEENVPLAKPSPYAKRW